MADYWRVPLAPERIRFVDSAQGEGFESLLWALRGSRIIALDAEWKPVKSGEQLRVSLLQIACRLRDSGPEDDLVFIVDLLAIPSSAVVPPFQEALSSPRILKLGFKLRQDLINLASTWDEFVPEVEAYVDIGKLHRQVGKAHRAEFVGQTASLAHICGEVLGQPLCKELQCSDWELRPLSDEQIAYAAADALCLLAILDVLQDDLIQSQRRKSEAAVGVSQILYPGKTAPYLFTRLDLGMKKHSSGVDFLWSFEETLQVQEQASAGKKNTRKKIPRDPNRVEFTEWCGPPPWDPALGGDGCPKFLCDIMVEGLARQLRCVGVDAACPHKTKPDVRRLIEQAESEGRVLLTRDRKLLAQRLVSANQAYYVKHPTKRAQLNEIIQTFNLNIKEELLLSRCTRCNGELFPEALTAEQAKLAAPEQEISSEVLMQEGLLFWQCSECRHLYWQGLQFRRAMQRFTTMCS